MPRDTRFENFDLRIWAIRAIILFMNMVVFALLNGAQRVTIISDRMTNSETYYTWLPWLCFIPTVAGFAITFLPHKIWQAAGVVLTAVGVIAAILFRAGAIKL